MYYRVQKDKHIQTILLDGKSVDHMLLKIQRDNPIEIVTNPGSLTIDKKYEIFFGNLEYEELFIEQFFFVLEETALKPPTRRLTKSAKEVDETELKLKQN